MEAFHFFQGAGQLLGVQLQEMRQLHLIQSTSPPTSKRIHTSPSFRGAQSGISSDSVCAFPAMAGFPLPAPLQLRSRSQKWEASLSAFSPIFNSFPLLPSTSPALPALPGHLALLLPRTQAHERGEGGTRPYSQREAGLVKGRASGRVFQSPRGL